MKLIILNDYDQASEWAAKYIRNKILQFKPGPDNYFTLGLPTGKKSSWLQNLCRCVTAFSFSIFILFCISHRWLFLPTSTDSVRKKNSSLEIDEEEDSFDQISTSVLLRVSSVSCFLLPLFSGGTPLGCYKKLIEYYKNGELSFQYVKTFNMDEYVGEFLSVFTHQINTVEKQGMKALILCKNLS